VSSAVVEPAPSTVASRTLRVSVGVMAHNEERVIADTLRSLAGQSLFGSPDRYRVEVVVVANGCTDRTVAAAEAVFAEREDLFGEAELTVVDVERAGLANAWNTFIHEYSDPSADHLVVMAADIVFLDARTLQSMVDVLVTDAAVHATVDRRVKDVAVAGSRSLRDRVSVLASGLSAAPRGEPGDPAWISGQLVCLRATAARAVHFPTSLPTDDCYLYRMLVTDQLTHEPRPGAVVLAPDAAHAFEAYTDVSRLLRHEQWLIFGDTVVDILDGHLRAERSRTGLSCGEIVAGWNAQDPEWLNGLLARHVAESGRRRFVARELYTRRLRSLSSRSLPRRVLLAPVALAAAAVDAWCASRVDRKLRTDAADFRSGGWGKGA